MRLSSVCLVTEAIAMDPQVRQVLEVVYEGLENAGIPLESLTNQPVGCFVGSFAGDYADIHARDPEDRVPSVTIGIGGAMLSNRVSHFLRYNCSLLTLRKKPTADLLKHDYRHSLLWWSRRPRRCLSLSTDRIDVRRHHCWLQFVPESRT